MKIFSHRLKELRKEKGITQEDLGKIVSVGKSTISQYESRISRPDHEIFNMIADYFNVSTDYLYGRTDIRETPERKILDLPLQENTLVDALLRITSIVAEYGLSKTTMFHMMKKAVEKFGVPMADGYETEPAAHLSGPNMPGTGAFKEDDEN